MTTDNENTIKYILKGEESHFQRIDGETANLAPNSKTLNLDSVKKTIQGLLNIKNVSFLFGAGASTNAIPTMAGLQKEFEGSFSEEDKNNGIEALFNKLKKDNNLEEILGMLYSLQYVTNNKLAVLDNQDNPDIDSKNSTTIPDRQIDSVKIVTDTINSIEKFIYDKVNLDFTNNNNEETNNKKEKETNKVLENYTKFYQKVAFRNKDLARINVFTTNYDLFNEHALDLLHIDYNSGFGGGVRRYFNPARFHYTFAKKLDASIEKFEPIENMVYLYKLHGSINWRKTDTKAKYFFDIEEDHNTKLTNEQTTIIYPTPLKEGDTLASPYSDLMREMKAKLLLPHSVLFVIGYGFGDDHINSLIYQALSVNTALSIYVFGTEIGKIRPEDPRLYQLCGKAEFEENNTEITLHYFDNIVEKLLPDSGSTENPDLLTKFNNFLNTLS